MSKIILLFVFTALFACAFAALSTYPAPALRDYEGCRNSDYPEIKEMKEGETVSKFEGKCLRAECHKDGSITLASCGSISTDCELKEDLTKPYPDCCPKPACK